MKVVEAQLKVDKVAFVFRFHLIDQRLRVSAEVLRSQHNRRTVRVVGPYPYGVVATHALEANPDIGLHVFHHVPEMDRSIGIGQGAGDENVSWTVVGH